MKIGMLWFDNDPKTDLAAKVIKAANFYKTKYGEEPNLCFVHPVMITETKMPVGSISVCTDAAVMPNHFWVGVQQQPG